MGLREEYLKIIDRWATQPFSDGIVGVPYLWGHKDPTKGLDCSGLVTCAGEAVGIWPVGYSVGHNAASLSYLNGQSMAQGDLLPGDMCFYGPDAKSVDHVMIFVGDGRVVGASGGGTNCTTVEFARSIGACVHYKNSINYRSDLVGFGRLPVPTVQ